MLLLYVVHSFPKITALIRECQNVTEYLHVKLSLQNVYEDILIIVLNKVIYIHSMESLPFMVIIWVQNAVSTGYFKFVLKYMFNPLYWGYP